MERALACGGLRPGVWWPMAAREESSLSEVRLRKLSVLRPSSSEPSCSSCGGERKAWKPDGFPCWENWDFTHAAAAAAGRHFVHDDGGLEKGRKRVRFEKVHEQTQQLRG